MAASPFVCTLCSSEMATGSMMDHMVSVHKIKLQTSPISYTLEPVKEEDEELESFKENVDINDSVTGDVKGQFDQPDTDIVKTKITPNLGEEKQNCKFHCSVCDKTFASKWKLNRHKDSLLHNPERKNNESTSVPCDICGKYLSSKSLMLRHKNDIHIHPKSRREPKAPCPVCNKIIALRRIPLHVASIHEGKKNFTCDICNAGFTYPEDVKHHKKQIHENMTRKRTSPEVCHLCGKVFCKPCVLQRHIQSVHEKSYDFECDSCGRKFTRKSILRSHMKLHDNVNVTEEPEGLLCSTCGKTFESSKYLKIHVTKSHADIANKPFKCDKCDKSFMHVHALKKHESRKHSEEDTRVQCKICLKFSSHLDSLTYHMKRYHGDAHCDLCGRSYASYYLLQKHLRFVHGAT